MRAAGTAEEPGHLCLSAYSGVWFGESQVAAAAVTGCAGWQPLQAQDPDSFLCPHPRGVSARLTIGDAHFKIYLCSPLLHFLQKEGPGAEIIPGAAQFSFTCASKSCKLDIVPGEELLEEVLVRAVLSGTLFCQQKHRGESKSTIACKILCEHTETMGTAIKLWNLYPGIKSLFLTSCVLQN